VLWSMIHNSALDSLKIKLLISSLCKWLATNINNYKDNSRRIGQKLSLNKKPKMHFKQQNVFPQEWTVSSNSCDDIDPNNSVKFEL